MTAPHLGERDGRGALRQQDADDFQNTLFTSLTSVQRPSGVVPGDGNIVDSLFGLEFEARYVLAAPLPLTHT